MSANIQNMILPEFEKPIQSFNYLDITFNNQQITNINIKNKHQNQDQDIRITQNNLEPFLNFIYKKKKIKNTVFVLNLDPSYKLNNLTPSNLLFNLILNQTLNLKTTECLSNVYFLNKSINTPILSFEITDKNNETSKPIFFVNINYLIDILDTQEKPNYPFIIKLFKYLNDNQDTNIFKQAIRPSQFAYNLYKKFFLNNEYPLYTLNTKMSLEVSKAFKTATVDVYYHKLNSGYHYDVNSLYPHSMLKEFPLGKPKTLTFDNPISNSSLYGFYYVTVELNQDINYPFLIFNEYQDISIAPKGKWTDWYFSEEIHLAIKLGYNIKIHKITYYNKTAPIFKEYVDNMYLLKKQARDPSQRKIAKLLLNSLYGKFAQINNKAYKTINKPFNIETNEAHNTFENIYIRKQLPLLHIASIITAYSRIHMQLLKEKYHSNKIAYVDTDSIITEQPLPEFELSDNNLGKLKLKTKFTNGIFIKPKVYGYIDQSNNEVIVDNFRNSNLDINKLQYILDNINQDKYIDLKYEETKFKNIFPYIVEISKKIHIANYENNTRITTAANLRTKSREELG